MAVSLEGGAFDQQACEAPRDCKHGQLRRSCQLCEIEAEEHILRYGGIIEVAVRNQNVAEYMGHWEDRAEKAEKRVTELDDLYAKEIAAHTVTEKFRRKAEGERDGFKSQLAAEREHGRLLQIRLDEARALNDSASP
jgi:hypothetical protein